MSGVATAIVATGYLSSRATGKAADQTAAGQAAGIAEEGRQFDITQEQMAPWREAGERGLTEYERMLGEYRGAEGAIPSNIPGAYRSPTDLPGMYDGETGDYLGTIESDVQDPFSFTREDFEQYKDPGYEFRMEESLEALDRRLGAAGKRRSGVRPRYLMDLAQNLASEEFGAARGRALTDYESRVGRERDQYGRSIDQYGRQLEREGTRYGRGREQYTDLMGREQELYGRGLRDYGLDVAREAEQYGRGVEQYGRQYVDPMNRYAAMANVGQTTTQDLATQRGTYASSISQGMANVGQYQAAGTLGQAGAYAGAIRDLGGYFTQPAVDPRQTFYRGDVWGNP